MALPKKPRKTKASLLNEDAFNRYCLTYCDYKGNPFMYMQGTQIFQNPVYIGLAAKVIDDFRNSLK